jgi:metal-dependent amidase/aminoacylase/carboxypeptidase family protein
VIDCAQGAAMATGCHLKYEKSPGYKNIIPNKVLGNLFAMHLSTLGREIAELDPYERMGSTDMGDISHIIPAIHPYLAIAPEKTPGHTLEFKEYAHSETGKSAMLDASKALALTAADLLLNTQLLSDAKNELLSIHNSK